mmetsp:Transcript_19039/g.36667  ORF Transcript_19039/g.36667 Transcript_19039/m.36667 type:complete len:206 (-) Transcript_19039:1093-1710(-)
MSTSCAALFTVRLLTSSLNLLVSRLSSPLAPCKPLIRKSRALRRLPVSFDTLAWCLSTPSTRSLISLWKSSSCFLRSDSSLVRRVASVLTLPSIFEWMSMWTSWCLAAVVSRSLLCCARSSSNLETALCSSSICRTVLALFISTLSSSCLTSPRNWLKVSSTFLRRLSTSSRNAEAMSRTVFTEASMSSFISFQAVMSVFASSFI